MDMELVLLDKAKMEFYKNVLKCCDNLIRCEAIRTNTNSVYGMICAELFVLPVRLKCMTESTCGTSSSVDVGS